MRTKFRTITVILLTLGMTLGNLVPFSSNFATLIGPKPVKAATFTMQTGYYMGNGTDNRVISGVGFTPNMVMIRDETATGSAGILWKSSSMSSEITAALGDALADISTNAIQALGSGTFTLGTDADVNTSNIRYIWIAFGGSDCSSSGTFCVGSYTGDGNATKALTSVGFQPNLVVIKRSGTTAGTWRTSDMASNVSQFFAAANEDATGAYIRTLDATGFTVGNNAAVNTNANTYWYFAFKEVVGAMDVGTYTGDGVDGKSITTPGFQPNFVWAKGANTTAAQSGHLNLDEVYGDYSPLFTDATSVTDRIQTLTTTGFTVGGNAAINESTKTYYYAAFGGTSAPSGSGTYQMASGAYAGTGSALSVTGIPFQPDLVIIRSSTSSQTTVFRTSLMIGDTTIAMADNTAKFTGGITSLDSTGFTLGTSGTVNTAAQVYHWYAFGNAFEPQTNSGAADFAVGVYTGSGSDDRTVFRLPMNPNMIFIKGDWTDEGTWRTSYHVGDDSSLLSASANAANYIQAMSTNTFQIGTDISVNRGDTQYYWFAFKNSSTFNANYYVGNGSYKYASGLGFEPEVIFSKSSTAVAGYMHSTHNAENNSMTFAASASPVTGALHHTLGKGFVQGATGNVSDAKIFYAGWKNPSPKIKLMTGYYGGDGTDDRAITGIGFQPDLVILKDDDATGTDGVLFKTSAMAGEATSKLGDNEVELTTNAIQSLDSDGFTVGTNADVNSANIRYHWIAVGGSDCSSTGYFCVNNYTGNGSATQTITAVGFQPDLVVIKGNIATGENAFRTSDMGANSSQFFANINQDNSGAGFQTLNSDGFTVGNSLHSNNSGTTYRYFAVRKLPGVFGTGSFTGNATDNRTIGGLTFFPDFFVIKNSNNVTPQHAIYNTRESYGDSSNNFIDSTKVTDGIQALFETGYQVGASAVANGSGNTIYYWGFGGAAKQDVTGTYNMAVGTYTGNGTSQTISGLSFEPDLVIVKSATSADYSVFRTRIMASTTSCYFGNAAVCFATGITALTSDGFSVGASTTVNTNTTTYHYQAFGNAYQPETNTGAFDFAIGEYRGNGIDSRDMALTAFQPSHISIKLESANAGAWKVTTLAGDSALHFTSTLPAANIIQALNTNGIQVGTSALTNGNNIKGYWFAFRASPNMTVNSYTGNGTSQNITSAGMAPNLVWIKKNSATTGDAIFKPSSLAGDNTMFHLNTASATTHITGLLATGFSVGAGAQANTNATTYYYAVWKIPSTFTQNDFEWFVTANSVTLTNAWPPGGGTDLAENEVFTNTPSSKEPLDTGDKIRIQMNFTLEGSDMAASLQAFRLQYSQTTDCTSGSNEWIDVGAKSSSAIWRLFDEASIGDSTAQVNNISTSTSTAEGYYSEINPSATNPNEVLTTENSEWDWPVENNGAIINTTYCFRMVLQGTEDLLFNSYNSDGYPKLTTDPGVVVPTTEELMRHGKYFSGGAEQGFYWAQ